MQAMEEVGFDSSQDRLFALGDLIDRGDESFECLALLNEPWFYSVLGNHEYMMLSALRGGVDSYEWQSWVRNGGYWFTQLNQDQYDSTKELLPTLIDLPIAITLELADGKCIGLCHAETPGNDWHWFANHPAPEANTILKALWGREKIRAQRPIHIQGVDATFHGHTMVTSHTVLGNMHFVDTGAYLNQRVQLVDLSDFSTQEYSLKSA
jgi:serine/threonine protein phosphatase 1